MPVRERISDYCAKGVADIMAAFFALAILGIILIVVGIAASLTGVGAIAGMPIIMLGLVLTFIGIALGALNAVFQFYTDWWFITLPTTIFIAGFLIHRYFFRRI